MRKFYLVNDLGIAYYLDYRNNTLFTNPKGLGFINDNVFIKFDDDYLKIIEDNPLTEVSGVLIFLDNYMGYKRFLNYLKNSKSLTLYYESDELLFCNICIKSLSKGEIKYGAIESEIIFHKLGYWKKETVINLDLSDNISSKRYPYKYPFVYSTSQEGIVRIKNEGYTKAPLKIELTGDLFDPTINIIKEGMIISTCRIYYEKNNCTLLVDSEPTNQRMVIIDQSDEVNVYEYQDFTCDNFLFLERGSFDIEVKPGTSSNCLCKITITERFQ